MMTNKKIQPFLYVLQFTFTFSTRKIIIKTFSSIFDVLYSPFYDIFLIWRMGEWIWCCSLKNLQACGYHVPPSVETGWMFSVPFYKVWYETFCNKHVSLSFDMHVWRISRLSFSMAIHNQIYSEPTLMIVSSTINSKILVFL